MITRTLQDLASVEQLVGDAQASDEPVIVFDGKDECLVAMRPVVFEHILSDIDDLRRAHRPTLHL
jgi:hypothetical protein